MIFCYELLYCTDSENYLITMGPEQLYLSHSVKELQTLSALVSSFFKKNDSAEVETGPLRLNLS